jgi:periplasmic protein CpxP/Spy
MSLREYILGVVMAQTRILRSLVVALGLALAAPLAVQAHGGFDGHGGPHRGFHHKHGSGDHRGESFRKLNLSEAQRDKIFELRHAAEPAMRAKAKELRTVRGDLSGIATADRFDESRATALVNQSARAEAELTLMRLRLKNQIHNVLTPEQRQLAAQTRKQRFERVKAVSPAVRPAAQAQ